MNRYAKIMMGAGLLISLAACNGIVDYQTESFVVFTGSSAEVEETSGSLELPVYAYAKNGELSFPRTEDVTTTVTFETVDGTAKKDVDYTVEPANGVLTFDGTSEGSIKINIINRPGERTGDLSFTIRLVSASDGFTLGGTREITVVIKDMDHPLASVLGTYTASSNGTSWTMVFSPDESDETLIWIDGAVPMVYGEGNITYGIVSNENTVITIPSPQFYPFAYQVTGGLILYAGLVLNDGRQAGIIDGELTFTLDETTGIWTSDMGLTLAGFEEQNNPESYAGYFEAMTPVISLTKN